MSEPIYLTTLGLFFGTIVFISLLRSRTIIRKAQLQAENEASCRAIAERAAAAQESTAAALADLKTRIVAIEKVLKDVE